MIIVEKRRIQNANLFYSKNKYTISHMHNFNYSTINTDSKELPTLDRLSIWYSDHIKKKKITVDTLFK